MATPSVKESFDFLHPILVFTFEMANSTPPAIPETEGQKIWAYGVYVALGFAAAFGNLIVFSGIMKCGAYLRIRYALISALAMADILTGLGYLTAGISRIVFVIQSTDQVINRWSNGRF